MKSEQSVWKNSFEIPEREALKGHMEADALVIGAGMAGVLTARMLHEAGLDTVVLEADRIASGQSGNTTAKITSQHGLIYNRLINDIGKEKALQYAKANQVAINRYRELIDRDSIDCDFELRPSYLYSKTGKSPLSYEYKAVSSLGIDCRLTHDTELPFGVKGALRFENQASFNPLKFISALSQNLNIYEKSAVLNVKNGVAYTKDGSIRAKYIIFCSHYPFLNFPGYYFLRMFQERSYVIGLEDAADMNGMYYGIDKNSLSFRPAGKYLLLGGGSHRTGENGQGGKYAILEKYAEKYYPDAKITNLWSAQDCITLDGIPYIGYLSDVSKNMFVATGFGKWGMTSSMVSAMLISGLITKKSSPYEEVFSPHRFSFNSELAHHISVTVKGLGKTVFHTPRIKASSLKKGSAGIVEYKGRKIGVYKDEKGKVYAVSVRCPHLGCQLEWNPDEKSWDCPCHGSRFDFRGNLIDAPAQKNIKI